jgi:hypothetical protein
MSVIIQSVILQMVMVLSVVAPHFLPEMMLGLNSFSKFEFLKSGLDQSFVAFL